MLNATRAVRLTAVVVALLLPALAAPAEAGASAVRFTDSAIDEAIARGLDPDEWVPVLDGHVVVDARTGEIFLAYDVMAGDSTVTTPVQAWMSAGAKCFRMGESQSGDWWLRIYVKDCLERGW